MDIYVKDILENCINSKLIFGDENKILCNFCKDTRIIKENDVYVGIKGENFDGNLFYEEAFNKGACVCIVEARSIKLDDIKKIPNKTLIVVTDSIETIGILARIKRERSNIPVVAITGSVGKTSTKDIVASILSTKYKVLKTQGNHNNEIGLPLTILDLKDEEVAVLEMGMNHFGEISYLTKIAEPNIAVITNIGTAHIGNLGSRENILKAKLEITEGLSPDGVLIVNNDNDIINANIDTVKDAFNNVITIGINNKSNYLASDVVDDSFSSEFVINNKKYKVNVGGYAFVYNSLIAYAVAKQFDISDDDIYKGLSELNLTKNRLEKIITKNNITIINDSYNSSLDSIKNLIDIFDKAKYKNKYLVIGDVLELGEFEQYIHEEIAKLIYNSKATKVILVGNSINYTYNKLIELGYNKNNVIKFIKEDETYDYLNNVLKPNDLIALKGSNGIKLFNIVDHLN